MAASTRPTARLLGNLLLVLVVLVSLAFIAPGVAGFERYVITGGSMGGTVDVGAVVFEKPVAVEDLRVGDVITYLPPAQSGVSTLVTHRIHSIRATDDGRSVFRTKGDANADVDPWTFELYAGVQPRLEFSVPVLGYVFIGLADRSTRMLVIGVPAGLIALYSLGELVGAVRPTRRRGAPTLLPSVGT